MNFHRFWALLTKEARELFRDKISLSIGIVMPIVLLLTFGYAMSMDIKNIKIAIVAPQQSPFNREIINSFTASEYFTPTIYTATEPAIRAVKNHDADICLMIPEDSEKKFIYSQLDFQIAGNAVNASIARMREGYVKAALLLALNKIANEPAFEGASANIRMWFNEANDSKYYMVPGVIVIIMTVIGALLTSLVMAREYEHGNMESLFVTPMKPVEILLAKAVNNFLLGMVGLSISLVAARFLFEVPIRGNVILLTLGSSLYLIVSLGLGLLISSMSKNQFIACTLTMIFTLMPATMLSGFIYEINNMPQVIQYITWFVPARYYVEFTQTVFLVGNVWPLVIKDLGVLAFWAFTYMAIAWYKNPKVLG